MDLAKILHTFIQNRAKIHLKFTRTFVILYYHLFYESAKSINFLHHVDTMEVQARLGFSDPFPVVCPI